MRAFNFNGASEESEIAYFKPCSAPSNLGAPEIVITTRTELSFVWTAPEDDGACPILGYILYIDEGTANSDFSPIDESEIANKDYLRQHTVTFFATDEGKTFRYMLGAFNEIGLVQSSIGS